jgi:hypothetical protein
MHLIAGSNEAHGDYEQAKPICGAKNPFHVIGGGPI